jgi:DNA-binding transcriptional MerR regulator
MGPAEFKKLLTLKQAAELLSVSIETLLAWNEHQILKPTITSEGQIGYSEDQIEQFLRIRLHTDKSQSAGDKALNSQNVIDTQIIKTWQTAHEEAISYQKETTKHIFIPSLRILSAFTILSLVLGIIVFTQVDKLEILFDEYELSYQRELQNSRNIANSQISKMEISQKDPIITPIALSGHPLPDKNLSAEGEAIISAQNTALNTLYAKIRNFADAEDVPLTSDKKDKSGIDARIDGRAWPATAAGNIAYSQIFASKTIENDAQNSVFDEKGNIKGEAKDTLAINLGGGLQTLSGQDSVKRLSTNPFALLFFLILGLLAFITFFPRRPTLAPSPRVDSSSLNQIDSASEKVIEVGQKTDGTIVIVIDGKEFKVSKPELYSESDQFIERLMEVGARVKETEFEALEDEKFKFGTPLSRLVTRLGFVGIKRDLFFPRTSKDRVYFRRFLTTEDLKDMNLTTEQILQEFSLLS